MSCRLEALARNAESSQPWQIRQAASFRIFHHDDGLAARVAERAEAVRRQQLLEWLGLQVPQRWAPRCDIYIFHSRRQLVTLSGGDPKVGSAVSSPSQLYRGRIISRRINLAADDPDLFDRTLPHEMSHVVVSTLLSQQVPLWAHEGLATLEEPQDSRRNARDFVAAELAAGRTFTVRAIMESDRYPDQEYRQLYYAQAFSLVRFLVDLRGRSVFLEFLRATPKPGLTESALRRFYRMGYPELQQRWAAAAD